MCCSVLVPACVQNQKYIFSSAQKRTWCRAFTVKLLYFLLQHFCLYTSSEETVSTKENDYFVHVDRTSWPRAVFWMLHVHHGPVLVICASNVDRWPACGGVIVFPVSWQTCVTSSTSHSWPSLNTLTLTTDWVTRCASDWPAHITVTRRTPAVQHWLVQTCTHRHLCDNLHISHRDTVSVIYHLCLSLSVYTTSCTESTPRVELIHGRCGESESDSWVPSIAVQHYRRGHVVMTSPPPYCYTGGLLTEQVTCLHALSLSQSVCYVTFLYWGS